MISLSEPLSVKQLSDILQGCFSNPAFSNIIVYGEVYSIKLGKFSYIELGNQGNKQTSSPIIKCAFQTLYGDTYHLKDIKVGDVIQVSGKLSYYPHGCSITLWGNRVDVLQTQLGKNLLIKQKTLKKLDELGYLDPNRKRKIPRYVSKVAILTASNGAAYQDILNTLHKRFPISSTLYPIIVQGDEASKTIVSALERANNSDAEVIILGRGGGSKTDLSCFDDEKVALAIAKSRVPVITCIGHTIDTAIADRVSDVMAITPTEGASLINPSLDEINQNKEKFKNDLDERFKQILIDNRRNLEFFDSRLDNYSPSSILKNKKEKLLDYQKDLKRLLKNKISDEKYRIEHLSSDYKKLLQNIVSIKQKELSKFQISLQKYDSTWLKENGYSLIFQNGKKITSASELNKDSEIVITYSDGERKAVIKD